MKLAPQKIEEKTIQNFFEDLKFRLVIYDDARAQTDMYLASRFNVFDYLEPNENLLSDMIADLLDPKGKHGQKDAFLQVFLKQVGKQEFLSSFKSVNREFFTSNERRIDIVLDFENFGIGIENKPFAQEQVEQVGDYVDFLNKRYKGNFLMIYLSHDGLKPKSIDVKTREEFENNGKFDVWTFRTHLIAFIEASIKETQADKVRHFLRDFHQYVVNNFQNIEQPDQQ
jgi:hypothetical protein